jgi:hypothetical protein
MAQESPKDYWRRFDLADALLFSGELTQALDAFDDAIALVPVEARANTLTSVLGPLRNYVTAGVLDETLLAHVNIIIQKLELAGKAS